MIKNKITILILSTLVTINSYSNVVIVKDTPYFINTSDKIDEIERHFYPISDINLKKLVEIKKEQEYLLSFSDPVFENSKDFPSEFNKPNINIESKNQLKIKNEYQKIIKEYEMLDDLEAEIRYEKTISLMTNVNNLRNDLKDLETQINFIDNETAPYIKLEDDIKNNIQISKYKIDNIQNKVVSFVDLFISNNKLNEPSIKKINLDRVKKMEGTCPFLGFKPVANNSMVSFYYIQVDEKLCLSNSLPNISFDILYKLMNDSNFISIYEESLKTLAEESLKIGDWKLNLFPSIRDYKTQLRDTQRITRPAIRKIDESLGFSKSNLQIKKNKLLRMVEKEQDLIDYEMISFDNNAFERKKMAAEFIIFDKYKNAVNYYILDKISDIYEKEHLVRYNSEYDTINLEEIEAPNVIVVDYLNNKAEIFSINKTLAHRYRFDANYGWNKSSLVKLENKNALHVKMIDIESNMISHIIEITFYDLTSKY